MSFATTLPLQLQGREAFSQGQNEHCSDKLPPCSYKKIRLKTLTLHVDFFATAKLAVNLQLLKRDAFFVAACEIASVGAKLLPVCAVAKVNLSLQNACLLL